MSEVILFEHNEIAYRKLCDMLEHSKYATINHATGTGKSFIALKYLYEHRDKKFLYVAPTHPILNQLLNDCEKIGIDSKGLNLDQMTYMKLIRQDAQALLEEYDGFIFDEYQRTGAKESYKKIKEIKYLLEKSGKDKKFIGLSATPIRYLDRERNMIEELFDGNIASTLSLPEAMADGILPVPKYITTKVSCENVFNFIYRRTKMLPPSDEKNRIMSKLDKIGKEINSGDIQTKEMLDKYDSEHTGKYIVFCSDIQSLYENYESATKWFDDEIKRYKVHSRQKDKENQKEIDDFNNDKNGTSVLFCVDILNEGIHVEGVKKAIFLRTTISPIIYFQQLGRVLSFSERNGNVVVFDLVNNFSNHKVIYDLYNEFESIVESRIAEYPERKEHYEELLKKFQILNEAKGILDELNEIGEMLTPEKIAKERIDYSIQLLDRYIKNECKGRQFVLDERCKIEAIKRAYFTLSRNYKYMTNEQFIKARSLNMFMPEELMISDEEREQEVEGHESVFERECDERRITVSKLIDFVKENSRKPDIKNKDEKGLAEKYLVYIANLGEDECEQLRNIFAENNIELGCWEKVLLQEQIDLESDISNLINLSNRYIENKKSLPQYLISAIEQVIYNYNSGRHEELYQILDKSEELKEEEKEQENEERKNTIHEILDYLEENAISGEEDENSKQIKKAARLKYGERAFILRKYRDMKKDIYSSITNKGIEERDKEFLKNVRYFEEDEIINYYNTLIDTARMQQIVLDIIDRNKEITEQGLEEIKKKVQEGVLDEKFIDYYCNANCLWYNKDELMEETCKENLEEIKSRMIVLRAINFLNKNHRRPLPSSPDEQEARLANDMLTVVRKHYSKTEFDIINNFFNRRRFLDNTSMAHVRNILGKDKEGKNGEGRE